MSTELSIPSSEGLGLNIWSLFSGIGGLELGLESAGLGETTLQCEVAEYPLKVLEKHWPSTARIKDVRMVTRRAKIVRGLDTPDLICGGFPCQPWSIAGQKKGVNDERHLWPEFARIVKEFRPSWVVGENVPGFRSNGGLAECLKDLAVLGYDAEWIRFSAAAVGAPHLRERIFIVAYPGSERRQQITGSTPGDEKAHGRRSEEDHVPASHGESRGAWDGVSPRIFTDEARKAVEALAYANRTGWEEQCRASTVSEEFTSVECGGESLADSDSTIRVCQGATSEEVRRSETVERSGRCGSLPWGQWATEPDVGRVANGVPKRLDRIKALGNAVVPQCAYFVGMCIRDAIEREA